jgi:hypothetical protein
MSIRPRLLTIPLGIVIAACGGSSASVGDVPDSGSADSVNSDGPTADSGGSGDTGTSSDTGSDGSASETGSDAGSDSASRIDGNDGGGCPNVFGGYTMLATDNGGGCGNINVTAKQCIVHPLPSGTSNACVIRFSSEQPVQPLAVNGPVGGVDLQSDGTFNPVSLLLGSTNRSNCSGAWDEATHTMTVTCASGGGCVITMVKTSATCP